MLEGMEAPKARRGPYGGYLAYQLDYLLGMGDEQHPYNVSGAVPPPSFLRLPRVDNPALAATPPPRCQSQTRLNWR